MKLKVFFYPIYLILIYIIIDLLIFMKVGLHKLI